MKTLEQSFIDWEAHTFGFGYGTGEPHVLRTLKHFFDCLNSEGQYDYEDLEQQLGAETAWLLINALCHADIIEYGSSPRFAWLTPQGQVLREFVGSHTVSEMVKLTCERDDNYVFCFPDGCNCGEHYIAKGCSNPFWRAKP